MLLRAKLLFIAAKHTTPLQPCTLRTMIQVTAARIGLVRYFRHRRLGHSSCRKRGRRVNARNVEMKYEDVHHRRRHRRVSCNATTLALEALLDGQASALTQKAINLALAGDMAALRLCLDRILPPRKDSPVAFELPEMKTLRHGLRSSELVDLRWDQIDFAHAVLHVRRVKKGTPATHPVVGDEMRALRKLQRDQDPESPFVFTSERGSPFTTAGSARMVERAGVEARLGFPAHPHMLRHACGFALANKGHDTRALQAYLGHRNIQHTVRYTELSPGRFKDFWR